jgi:hypothetical protein
MIRQTYGSGGGCGGGGGGAAVAVAVAVVVVVVVAAAAATVGRPRGRQGQTSRPVPQAGALRAAAGRAVSCARSDSPVDTAPCVPAISNAAASSATLRACLAASGVLTSSCTSDSFGVDVVIRNHYGAYITEGIHARASEPAAHRRLFVDRPTDG